MESPVGHVYWDEPHLWSAALSIVLTPLYWILVSHIELRTRILSRIFCSRHLAVVVFAVTLLTIMASRNWKFLLALEYQPKWSLLQENIILWLGHVLVLVGLFLALRSSLALGFFGTFMGDYFNLCLRRRVTTFPYSWMTHPMYSGAFMMFLGMAIVHASQAGLLLALLAGLMYLLAASFEEPYTDRFYLRYPPGTRTVGVQVGCMTSIVEIAARTVATQRSPRMEVVEVQPEVHPGDFEVISADPGRESEEGEDEKREDTGKGVGGPGMDRGVSAGETEGDVEEVEGGGWKEMAAEEIAASHRLDKTQAQQQAQSKQEKEADLNNVQTADNCNPQRCSNDRDNDKNTAQEQQKERNDQDTQALGTDQAEGAHGEDTQALSQSHDQDSTPLGGRFEDEKSIEGGRSREAEGGDFNASTDSVKGQNKRRNKQKRGKRK